MYIVGSDFLCHNLNIRNRNLLFTAMTRTKGWLSISGIGDVTSGLKKEMEQSVANIPYIRFDGSDSNLLIVFYVQIMPDDLVMQLHRF
ncbi:hypothetical protein APECPE143_003523 [Escherichia coli]